MKKLAPVFIVGSGVLWGTIGLFVRNFSSMGLSPIQISAIRAITTAILMLAVLLIYDSKLLKIRIRDIWIFIGSGTLSAAAVYICYFMAIERVSLSVAAILMYTAPVFVLIMSAIFFGEKITGMKVFAMVLTFSGCVLVSGIFSGSASVSFSGILFGLASGVGYALYSIFSRFAINRGYKPLTITAYTFFVAAAVFVVIADFGPIFTLVGEKPTIPLYFILYSLVTTLAPYLLYTIGLGYVENSSASIMASIEPIVATVIGFIAFNEKPTFLDVIGICVVIFGIVMVNRKPRVAVQ